MRPLPGTPSDDVPGVLAAGRGDVSTLFVSMARRHPDGGDAEYLRWHTLDHRPEQHRLSAVRASLRLVSTPECRTTRVPADPHFDPVDHVMTYFFTDEAGLAPFNSLSTALGDAGRKLPLLQPVQRGVYAVSRRIASPRVRVGADVLPWWPVRGVYVLVESDSAPPSDALIDVDGVAGVWSAASRGVAASLASAPPGQTVTYCFLDDDPVATAERLHPVITARWHGADGVGRFAAPFYPVVAHEWERHLP